MSSVFPLSFLRVLQLLHSLSPFPLLCFLLLLFLLHFTVFFLVGSITFLHLHYLSLLFYNHRQTILLRFFSFLLTPSSFASLSLPLLTFPASWLGWLSFCSHIFFFVQISSSFFYSFHFIFSITSSGVTPPSSSVCSISPFSSLLQFLSLPLCS